MREHGYCFILKSENCSIARIRQSLGDFDLTHIPKMIARMGQCFTQTRVYNRLIHIYSS